MFFCRCYLLFVLFVLCCLFMCLCLFCFAFSCFQLCRVFLYRLITNITNITKHKTKQNTCMWLLLFVVVCAVCFSVLFVHMSVFVLLCFSCFQLCRVFLYRLITNVTNITIHQTNTHVCFCCCVLLFVLFTFLCCLFICLSLFCFAFLVSNYAACSFIGKYRTEQT